MKYKNQIKNILGIAVCSIFLAACDKVELPEAMGDAGQNIVKIVGGGSPAKVIKKPVDFLPTPTQILAVSLRRDVANEGELNKPMTVTIQDDTAAVRAANPAYIQMPAAWYTIQGDGVKTGGQGGIYTLNFKAGEFAKEILITIPNATLFNPSSLYGLGFTITSVTSGSGKISASKSAVVEIGAKNQWDGVYSMEGTFTDFANAAFTYFNAPQQYSLITTSATSCTVFNDDLGTIGYLFLNAGSTTYYGSYGLVITFDPSNGKVSDLRNYYGDPSNTATPGGNPALGSGAPLYAASNTRRAVLDPSGVNAVQGNKDILIKHWLIQPSVVTAPPSIRSAFNETWKYVGPR